MIGIVKLARKGRFRAVLAGLTCLVLLLWGLASLLPAIAQEPHLAQASEAIEDLQKRQQQLDRDRSQVIQERDRLKNLEKAAQGTLTGLQKTIKVTAEQIKTTETRLQKATQALRNLEVALVTAERSYRQKQSATAARLRFLQRQQTDRGWAVLLQSNSLNNFLDRRYQLRRVYQADRQILVDLKAEADRLNQRRQQVEKQKNEIALLSQQLLAQKAEVEAQAANQQELIGRLRTDRHALEAAETRLAQDSQDIGQLIQARLAEQRQQQRVATRGTGQMVFPSDGEITSSFGWRTHPILGDARFHAGVDFGADYGGPIWAADQGMVIFAGWYGGYGNTVIIDHGNGITTLYGHASEFYVAEGDSIQRGHLIAAVGSTGLSTGPHLHFEVRRDGEPIDPADFL